jgi:hypothetical protein
MAIKTAFAILSFDPIMSADSVSEHSTVMMKEQDEHYK